MDVWTITRQVFADELWQREHALVWAWPESAGSFWPIVQATATCQILMPIYREGGTKACRTLATVDPQGRYLCPRHWAALWLCAWCGAWLPDGNGGTCSSACAWAAHPTSLQG